MMRVLLVDDHPVVRHGVRQILMEHLKAMVGDASDAASALVQVRQGDWDVVVLDITMPGRSGLDLLKQLHAEYETLPVLVLSMHPANQFAKRAISAGALGYVTKDSAPAELVEAVQHVRRGRKYISGWSGNLHASPPAAAPASAHEALSDREYQVLRMLGSGQTVSQIAGDLGLSVKTVSTYRSRVLDKLGMRTNAELMRYAMQNGLLDS